MKKIFEFNAPFRKLLPLFLIMIGLVVFMSKSYAHVLDKYNANKKNGVEIVYIDEIKSLKIDNIKSGEEGTLTFKVKNNNDNIIKYSLLLEEDKDNLKDLKKYINFSFKKDSEDYTKEKNLNENNYIVKDDYIDGNKEITYQVKVSLDDNLTNELLNKTFDSKIKLITE